jgi:hypothetical protein
MLWYLQGWCLAIDSNGTYIIFLGLDCTYRLSDNILLQVMYNARYLCDL